MDNCLQVESKEMARQNSFGLNWCPHWANQEIPMFKSTCVDNERNR